MSEQLTCRQLIEFLMDYVEDELGANTRSVFDEHLAVCPACVNYLESYKETVRLGKLALRCEEEAVPEEVPDSLVRAILDARRRGDTA